MKTLWLNDTHDMTSSTATCLYKQAEYPLIYSQMSWRHPVQAHLSALYQDMAEHEAKESFGLGPSPMPPSPRTPCPERTGFVDSLNSAQEQTTYTGKCWSPSPRRKLFAKSSPFLEKTATGNFRDQVPPVNTSGRKIHVSPEPSLNLEPNPLTDPTRPTGSPSGPWPRPEITWPSRRKFVFRVTGLSEASRLTMLNQAQWNELAMFSGVQLEQASQGELGNLVEWTLTLKTLGPSSGAATAIKKLLLSMNFGAVLTSHTCSDGWIVTQSLWKSKAEPLYFAPKRSTSLPTWNQNNGTQM